ncbi:MULTISPECIES: DUF4260 family protein [Streptomycetaceae]|uniref:DUF4260 domain-containing protein n=1 Tax=Kitasatospora indigofera TaxID=67307 RepID=A0A919FBY1_9ACTN|nr:MULTISPECIES: DUF4260 family protein [Streptomycetaceae]MDQ0309859.1 hypothetical protein [Kitasatospora herbaricolor]OKI22636.1 hypothetical protein A6A07_33670 [Streptomyces sp. CB03911]GGU99126.1 hypothetical protein GCM10010495_07040 [Kitasatospora herbaricolor]GHH60201.1 hypothetical protein GCM10018781_04400 [Kitasatospora indigofera]
MPEYSATRTAPRPDPVDRLLDEAFPPAPAPDRLPWDSWTWRHPVGRVLSAGLGLGALALGAALGGLTTWTYWVALLAPDTALFYDLANAGPEMGQLSPKAARLYNLLHHPALPAAVITLGVTTFGQPLVVGGLAWLAHVALDRSFGYGKRLPDGRRC